MFKSRLIEPRRLVGDLTPRGAHRARRARLAHLVSAARRWGRGLIRHRAQERVLFLALDWSGDPQELVMGRGDGCDVVLADPGVRGAMRV